MEVKIIEFLNDQYVRVVTKYGELDSRWFGIVPPLGSIKHVELEIDELFEWGDNIFLSEEKEFRIESDNIICIIGKLESIDDDGYTVIRLGESIISIIIKGISQSIGEYVRLKVTDIELYDVGV
ncbi:hypothetical protein R9X47_22770 [Wukongibacter baidiensis]|uniref:hypothetical protein n=1 Tax=Wukongibacter baidiensis TaxID=1723361 RepID=UPI003D7FFAB9